MYILDVVETCNSSTLSVVLPAVKNIMTIIQIVAPILLIVMAVIEFSRLSINPDDKKGVKGIINKFVAAAIIFFIPMLINIVMGLVGENTSFSSCWNNASNTSNTTNEVINADDDGEQKDNKDNYKPGDYENWE